MNAQGGVELFANQGSAALNSTVWANGLVDIPAGTAIAEFRSTWRLEPDGRWRVVFDDGTCLCRRPE